MRLQITTLNREAHFLAQMCHESDAFSTRHEYASGEAYEGRADRGNTEPGDGARFKGRGLIQLTGRSNYRQFGKLLKLDLEDDPELATVPANAVLIACEFWRQHHLNHLCDIDDLKRITRRVNGGLNGLTQRWHYLVRARIALVGIAPDVSLVPLHGYYA